MHSIIAETPRLTVHARSAASGRRRGQHGLTRRSTAVGSDVLAADWHLQLAQAAVVSLSLSPAPCFECERLYATGSRALAPSRARQQLVCEASTSSRGGLAFSMCLDNARAHQHGSHT